ncbi:unnamed protein product [Owenia fusiformis]|uniref:alpha-amylase n=1 Tax=Owenia fusiformis TaxID=6347 RepID=A0A8S4NRU6_OWEFU|nr:unnamed protein product [Owenia fusiformis]
MENSSHLNSSCHYEYANTGTWHFILVTTILGIINAVVIGGNVLIVSAVFTCHKLRSVTNLFIASLACADLFLGVTVLPFSVAQEVLSYWIFGSFWCSIWLAVDVWMCTASILNLCVISLDRYLAITRPFKYHDLMSQARGKIFIGLVWIISFVICLPPLVGWNEQRSSIVKIDPPTIRHNLSEFNVELHRLGLQPENVTYAFVSGTDMPSPRTISCDDGPKRCELVSEPGYIVYSASGSFYIPCCILVFFYWRIYLAATRATKALKRGTITTKSHTRKGDYSPNSEVSVTLRVHRGGSKQFAESPSLQSRGSVRSYTGSIRSQQNGSSSWGSGQNGSVKSTKRHAALTTSRSKRSRSRASYTPINASINEHEHELPEKAATEVTPSPKARHSMPCPSLPRNFSITSDTNDFESKTITKMESEKPYITIPERGKKHRKCRSQPINSYSIDGENISITSRRALCFIIGTAIAGSPFHNSNCAENREVIVHLFEWKWTDIARECEDFLGPRGYCGVQVSPPNEHVLVTTDAMRPWWERYQPVSYKLESRSGNREQFIDMVKRCNKANVRIYVDLVVNHMAGKGRSGTGSGGTSFNSDANDFPGVPFSDGNFNSKEKCGTSNGNIVNYGDAQQVRNCNLLGLGDLDQSLSDTADKIVGFMNDVIEIGVAGFRVDAAKHMWPEDLENIFNRANNLNTEYFASNARPFMALEVIDMSNEPITGKQYKHLGMVTEFRYCVKIREQIGNIGNLRSVYDPGWGMMDPEDAFVFVDNHDNQRGHGASGNVLSHKEPKPYKMGVAFTLAYTYGFPRIMSSYEFVTDKDGPPHESDYQTKSVRISANGEGCEDGWVCEHRWRVMAGMSGFRKAVSGTNVVNWWSEGNKIAFSRGNKGFFAMTDGSQMESRLFTGMPAGTYCDVISGQATNDGCSGQSVSVGGDGYAQVKITDGDNPVFAIHIEAVSGGGSVVVPPTNGPGEVTTKNTDGPVSTSGPTSQPGASDFRRTVIFIKKYTNPGQDLFIRGGLNHGQRQGCTDDAKTSACAIPISVKSIGATSHYDKYNAWRVGDEHLDWYGRETDQGTFNGIQAEGTPAAWTSDSQASSGYNPLNRFGEHYWMVEMDMDCARTENGIFEFKSYVTGGVGWENDIYQRTCTGSASMNSGSSNGANHIAMCGHLNVFEFNSGSCIIDEL